MITEISAAISGLKAARDLVQGLTVIRDAAKLGEIKFELGKPLIDAQEQLFAAQEKHAALTRRIAELEQEKANMKNWEAERQRYDLEQVAFGAYAYTTGYQPGVDRLQTPHWACTRCFEDGKKSVLQRQADPEGAIAGATARWACPSCQTAIITGADDHPEFLG